jgi:hypothetical protein
MPRATLRNACVRPPEGDSNPSRPEDFCYSRTLRTRCFSLHALSSDTKRPVRRVNGIVAEGVERHGCRERRDGPWMALRAVPLERRWSERTLRAAQGRMQGQDFLVPFGATAKRDSPSRAKPAARSEHKAAQPVDPSTESAAPSKNGGTQREARRGRGRSIKDAAQPRPRPLQHQRPGRNTYARPRKES